MSRFYNTLKEASRFQPAENAAGETAEAKPIENQIPEAIFQMLPESVAPAPAAPNTDFGNPVSILIDRKNHLIPHSTDPGILEIYRRLRAKILQQRTEQPFRTLVVASPNPQEGKTLTVFNLGLSFAMLPDFKVLVVDGDLRRGSFEKWLGIEGQPGFSNLIDGSARLEEVILKSPDLPMSFMLRGTSKVGPAELLHSAALGSQLRNLAEHFDLVLVDSSPATLLADVQSLAKNCDAVLLVAKAFSTSRKSFQKAAAELKHARIIGTVLNASPDQPRSRRYNGYY